MAENHTTNAPATKAVIHVWLKDGVLDPQGVTIQKALTKMGYPEVMSVRTGKFFELEIDGNPANLKSRLESISRDLLANPVIEKFSIEEGTK